MRIGYLRTAGVGAAGFLAIFIAGSAFGQSNRADSFESYTNNASIIGTNGWIAKDSTFATVTNGTYHFNESPYTNIFHPLRDVMMVGGYVTHTNFVVLNTDAFAVSNLLDPSGVTNINVWVDTMVKFQPWSADTPSSLITADTNVQAAVFLDTNQYLVIYHQKKIPVNTYTNWFTTNTSVTYDSNAWHRLTITMDYSQAKTSGRKYFKVQVDGSSPITNAAAFSNVTSTTVSGGWWFVCANYNTVSAYVSSVSFSGTGFIDDFSVTNAQPRYGWLISATNPTPMGISFLPYGQLEVPNNLILTFTNSAPSNYWVTSGIASDNVNLAFTTNLAFNYTFSPITTDHTYCVILTPDVVTNHTPKWWLATYVTHGVSPSNADALADSNGDGIPNWQAWLTSTDPTNANSKFQITDHFQLNGTTYVKWISPCVDPMLPPFGIKRSTNISAGTNGFVLVDSNVPRAKTNIWAETNPTNAHTFYKIVATNSF